MYIKQRNKAPKHYSYFSYFSLPFLALSSVHNFLWSCLVSAQGIRSCIKNREHFYHIGVLFISSALRGDGKQEIAQNQMEVCSP